VVAILVKLDSPGPVLFKQERIGKNFVPFLIYKFRTMKSDAYEKGPLITISGDKRVTIVGRMLRKWKIDEFPQLINVIKGEMSLVGPRPEVFKYVKLYESDYEEILSVRPGITDLSSLSFRNEESILKNKADPENFYKYELLPKKIKLAREYIKKSSVTYDLKLILLTFYKLFKNDIHQRSNINV
jgi:lipopolysaccharide/colanic/teichoic acid biosynthesis glycosyltransferase